MKPPSPPPPPSDTPLSPSIICTQITSEWNSNCNTPQHTANTLQHTATHCNTLQHVCMTDTTPSWKHEGGTSGYFPRTILSKKNHTATHCDTLRHMCMTDSRPRSSWEYEGGTGGYFPRTILSTRAGRFLPSNACCNVVSSYNTQPWVCLHECVYTCWFMLEHVMYTCIRIF